MADKVPQIHSLPNTAPWQGGLPPVDSEEHPGLIRLLDRMMGIQRPVVIAHIRSIRLRSPQANPQQIVRILERRYLTAVTTGGAAVGATAVVPGVGTAVTLALSGVETLGFLEATALFAQSVAEVHGIPVADPQRARALVLALMLGQEGVDLVAQLAGQASGKGRSRDKYWGEVVTKTLPRAAIGPLLDRLKTSFVHQFAVRGGASWLGKALPFGIGAAVGGAGNHVLGRRVLTSSHRAFGPAPAQLPALLEPEAGTQTWDRSASAGVRRIGSAVAQGVSQGASTLGSSLRDFGKSIRRKDRKDAISEPEATELTEAAGEGSAMT